MSGVANVRWIAPAAVLAAVAAWRISVLERRIRTQGAAARVAETRVRSLLEAGPEALMIVDLQGSIVEAGASTEQLLGYGPSELTGLPIEMLVAEAHRVRYTRHRDRVTEAAPPAALGVAAAPVRAPATVDLALLRADGAEVPVQLSMKLVDVRRPGDEPLLAISLEDVGERRSAAEIRRRLAAIVEHTDDAVFSITPAGQLSSWNGGADRLYGYSSSEAAGTAFAALIPADREAEEQAHLERVLGSGAVERYETVHLHREGRRIDVSVTLSPIREATGEVTGASAITRDITERKRFEGQLQYLADHDALTGLLNRRRFEEDVERELARVRRTRDPGALLTIDLDNFKEINDALGHSAGDDVIKRAAELLRARLRGTDVLARLGGDEFAALLPGTSVQAAALVATGLLEGLRTEVGPSRLAVGAPITGSIGIAIFDGSDEVTAAELLAGADIAMYDAKDAGRDRVCLYEGAPAAAAVARTTWPQRIRRALEQERLVLMAQPIVALNGPPESRHELLVRMLGDDGELIPPGAFLHAAERHDLILEIDRWVLREGVRVLAREQRAGNELSLGMNLSASSLIDPELADRLAGELEATGADGAGLWLEVRETTAILNVERARKLAAGVRQSGCELAVDDFGAGFASFYYLEHLEFDYVKIDGEFVAQLRTNTTNQLVVQSIVDIARGLGKRTIAERVGDLETLELLRRLGVDYAQGFLLGAPVLLDDVDLSRPVSVPAGLLSAAPEPARS